MRHQHALLEPHALDVVLPHRQARLEPECHEVSRAVEPIAIRRAVDAGQGDDTAIPETELLPDVIEHHRPPERRWQRRNQQTVISPRDGAGNRSTCITAEAVRHQPFLPGQLFSSLGRRLPTNATRQIRVSCRDDRHVDVPCRSHEWQLSTDKSVGNHSPTCKLPLATCHFSTGLRTTAECPRIVHPLSPNTAGVPVPPYSGSSLDHRTCQTYPSGGARSGSGNDPAMRSGPRLIHNSRSSAGRSNK